MSQQRLARPYAKAIFEMAQEAQELDVWSERLALASAVLSDACVKSLQGDPRLTDDWFVELVLALSEQSSCSGGHWENFLRLIAKAKRFSALPAIAARYEDYKAEALSIKRISVRLTAALTEEQKVSLSSVLSGVFSSEVALSVTTAPELLGGGMLSVGDTVVDGTVRGRLSRLAEALEVN